MNVHDVINGAVVLGVGGAALATGDVAGTIGTGLAQFGGIGLVLAWLTLVDIPARNKAAADRESARDKAAADREIIWKDQLAAERIAGQAREDLFRIAIEKVAVSLAAGATSQAKLSEALESLTTELTEERRSRQGHPQR